MLDNSFQHCTTSIDTRKCSPAIEIWQVAGLDITLAINGKSSFESHHESRNINRSRNDSPTPPVRWVYHMAISNFVVVIQNFILELWCLDCVLASVIILPRFHFGFLSLPFCNYLASISCWVFLFCLLWLSCLDSMFGFCLLSSVILLPRFHVDFLSFAF